MSAQGSIADYVSWGDYYGKCQPRSREEWLAAQSLGNYLRRALMAVSTHGAETITDFNSRRVIAKNTGKEVLALLFKIRHLVEQTGHVNRLGSADFGVYVAALKTAGYWNKPSPVQFSVQQMKVLRATSDIEKQEAVV